MYGHVPSPESFQGYVANYGSFSSPRILQHSVSSNFEPVFRHAPPLYYNPFLHWVPNPYGVEDLRIVPTHSSGKHRRNRTAFSQQQLAALEQTFAKTQYPDLDTRDQLSRRTGLPEPKIQVWFKNRRAKQRKMQKSLEKTYSVPQEKTKDEVTSNLNSVETTFSNDASPRCSRSQRGESKNQTPESESFIHRNETRPDLTVKEDPSSEGSTISFPQPSMSFGTPFLSTTLPSYVSSCEQYTTHQSFAPVPFVYPHLSPSWQCGSYSSISVPKVGKFLVPSTCPNQTKMATSSSSSPATADNT